MPMLAFSEIGCGPITAGAASASRILRAIGAASAALEISASSTTNSSPP